MTLFSFAQFQFNTQSLQLTKIGETVKIRPKCAEVLAYLLENRTAPVSKEELLEQFWPGLSVQENVLFQVILDIRNILDSGEGKNAFIMTFPKKGYQWV